MLSIAKEAISRGTKKIDFRIEEHSAFDPSIPLVKYAIQATLEDTDLTLVDAYKEYLKSGTARFMMEGDDPNQLYSLTTEEKERRQALAAKLSPEISPVAREVSANNPWCVYYSPTPISAKAAGYSDFTSAAQDAVKFTRKGELEAHVKKLQATTDKLNTLVKQGYKQLHFVSVASGTEMADGRTDLRVGLTDKSQFVSIGNKTPSGQRYLANIPSEESFTTPNHNLTDGKVSITRPITINGSLVEGIELVFKNGKLDRSKTKASKNDVAFQS